MTAIESNILIVIALSLIREAQRLDEAAGKVRADITIVCCSWEISLLIVH